MSSPRAAKMAPETGQAEVMEDATQKGLASAYLEYNSALRITGSKTACILVMALMPVGFSLDYFVYPNQVGFFFLLRLLCALLAFVLWGLLRAPIGKRYFRQLAMTTFVLPSVFMSLMIYCSEGAKSPYYAGLNLVLIGLSWVSLVDVTESFIATVLTLVIYWVACLAHGSGTLAEYFANFYFIALTGVIVVTGSYFLNRFRFQEYALRSELDRSRQELQESHAKLVELDRAKSTFFANVSHELRTPLTLLIGPLERLRHRNPPSTPHEQVEMLDIMYNNAMRLLRLINDLLDLVRLDSGTIRVRREKVEFVPFLEGIAKSVSAMAEQRKLHFETQIEVQRETFVHIDRDKLEKIILNLLFNSFKFTPESGTVTLSAGLKENTLTISVKDTGKGIASADLSRIFNRFWQAEAAATRQYQGVGIGLALVKELAEAHGGSVSVESKVDKGTTIQVTVDASADTETEIEQQPQPTIPQPSRSEWLSDLYRRAELFPSHVISSNEATASEDANEGKPLVLIADDEPEMRRFLHSQLKNIYTIREARNGSEALELARAHDFVLILLDLMMPGIDGITLTRQLREESHTASVPIIILTARADEESKMQALEAGVTDFLTKPFASSELAARCRNLLNQQQLQQNLAIKTHELEIALEQIKDTEAQLVHQAKMAALGQLSSGLMHEINNPLNFANTASHLLGKRLNNIEIEDREQLNLPLRDLQDGIRRVADIISSLRSFIHPDTSNFNGIVLKEAIETSARFVQIPASEIAVEIEIADDLKVWGNRNQLIHLFINLLQNAADSLREKAAPEKKIKIEAALQNGRILLICEDNGKGIKTAEKEKVFDAFFTTKPVGSGVGLGLNISYRIVQNHQGDIRVESQENEFCRFIITLHPNNPSTNNPIP